ncbi:hypothetical protein N9L68_03050 [bacterium]|nr:hypothetical protein [bacterium]
MKMMRRHTNIRLTQDDVNGDDGNVSYQTSRTQYDHDDEASYKSGRRHGDDDCDDGDPYKIGITHCEDNDGVDGDIDDLAYQVDMAPYDECDVEEDENVPYQIGMAQSDDDDDDDVSYQHNMMMRGRCITMEMVMTRRTKLVCNKMIMMVCRIKPV